MSSIHVARQGFVTKSALPSVSRERGSTTVADNSTVLLLNGNGTNAAQNNTFLDSSTNNFSITRNGNTTQGSYSPFTLPDGQWSNFFDGSGDFLSFTGVNSAFEFGTGDFTVECWVNPSATPADAYIWDFRPTSNNGAWASLDMQSSKFVYVANAAVRITGTTVPVVGRWYHVAISRSGTSTRMFVNGVQEGSTYTDSTNYVVASGRPYIGTDGFGNTFPFMGYISNFRILKGTAAYTTTFTPPTANLTAITNTSLLTCQSNRFRDNSSNNFAITRNGDVRVTPLSPFEPTSAYDPSVNGGSGYFDGTGDFLTVPDSDSWYFGAGDFTVEGWIYYTGTNNRFFMFSQVENFSSNNNRFMMYYGGTAWTILHANSSGGLQIYVQASDTLVSNTWTHMAFVKSGTTFSVYKNGVLLGSGTDTDEAPQINSPLYIGTGRDDGVQMFTQGYISNYRVVKGTAVYTSAFTPPTAPVTNITNTSLLLNFTNAGIFDTAGDNVIETVGNAQIDTAIKKYGSGSLEFDGTDDGLKATGIRVLPSGREAYTIEFWMWLNNNSSIMTPVTYGTSSTNLATIIQIRTSGVVRLSNFGNDLDSPTSSVTASTWHHVACQYDGTTRRIFVDGVQVATDTTTTVNVAATDVCLVGVSLTSSNYFNGYIDDLRITKGQARYTSDGFTPPTSELAIVGTVPNIVNNSTYGVYQLA